MNYSHTKLVERFYNVVPFSWYASFPLGDLSAEKLKNLGKIIVRDIDGYKIFPVLIVTYDEPDNKLYIEFLREDNLKKMIEVNSEGTLTIERNMSIDEYKNIVNNVLKYPEDNMKIVELK